MEKKFVHVNICLIIFYSKWPEIWRCFLTTSFQLVFRIFCQKSPGISRKDLNWMEHISFLSALMMLLC